MATTYDVSPGVTSVTEGNQVTFTITRSGDRPSETVYFSTLSDGTATYGEGDYRLAGGGAPANVAVSFSSGQTSRTVTLDILVDNQKDTGENFRAIVQRNTSDPVLNYLARSGFVSTLDGNYVDQAEEPGPGPGILSWFVPIAYAGEKDQTTPMLFKYPIVEQGTATEARYTDGTIEWDPDKILDDDWYNASDFGAQYSSTRWHLGEDWNSAAGGNSDQEEPVYAIGDGRVVYAQDHGSTGFGNTVVVEHLVGGKKFYSLYAHLSAIDVETSETYGSLGKIGEIGATGFANGVAHLHF